MAKNRYELYQGDCLEVMDKLIKQNVKVDMVLTDPPYGTTNCKWDSVIDLDEMWERLNKLIKPNGAIVVFAGEPFASTLRMSNIKKYKYDWYWNKNNSGNVLCAKYMPLKVIENICVFSNNGKCNYNPQMIERTEKEKRNAINELKRKGRHKKSDMFSGIKSGVFISTANPNYKYPVNLLNYSTRAKECNNKVRVHPTQKPVDLLEYLIKTYTNEGELILDFTMGSGSTGVAALNTNRKFIGIELDKKYFNIAKQRIEEAENNKISFKLGEAYE